MKRVVITGGGGYLAGHLAEHLRALGGYEIVLINRSPRPDRDILQADLANWDRHWTTALQDSHAVVHLAAYRTPGVAWAELQRDNIDATLNLFEAAAQGRCRRVVFASTSWVLGGHIKKATRLTSDLPPSPTGAYAASKMVGESIARFYARERGLTAICFRVGSCHPDEDRPDPTNLHRQYKWLSPRDFCQAVEKAIETDGIDFALLNLTSDIEGSPWDIGETKRLLGYVPQDSARPNPPSLALRLKSRIRHRLGF